MEHKNAKILIIEDEGVVAADLADCLNALGYIVCGTANCALEAYKLLEDEEPDLALVDINIKGNADGTEVARRIEERHSIPYIYLTAYFGEETFKKVSKTNPSGYLVKPYQENDLDNAIQNALS